MSWTDERIGQLKTMWEKGMTASQIAEELGGVSRNAVIGKAHRLGLQSRPSPVKAGDGESKRKAKAKAAAPAPSAPATPAAPVARKSLAPTRAAAPVVSQPLPRAQAVLPAGTSVRSIGPGGFVRQNPGEQSAPSQPAPPRRLVPAKPAAEYSDKTSLLDLNERICKWPLGHPGEPDFHFCGDPVNAGFPYCVAHCGLAFQAQMPRQGRKTSAFPLTAGGPPKPADG
jgi:GcrA cell cycle regulator